MGDILFHELKSKLSAARLAELRVGTRHDATEIEKSSVPVYRAVNRRPDRFQLKPLNITLAPSQWVVML